jgi:hypothetical protein
MKVHFEVSRKKNRIMKLGGEMIGVINLVTK